MAPYSLETQSGGTVAVWYAGYTTTRGSNAIAVDSDAGYHLYNLDSTQLGGASSSEAIYFDVKLSAAPTSGKRALVMLKVDGQLVPIAYAGTETGTTACLTSGAACQTTPPSGFSSSYSWAAHYSGSLTVRLGVYPKDICDFVNSAGGTSTGCTGGAINFPTSGPAVLSFAFYVVESADDETTPAPSTLTGTGDVNQVRFIPYSTQPTLASCTDSTSRYNAGDGQIQVQTSAFGGTGPASGPNFYSVIALGKKGGATDTSIFSNNDIFQRIGLGGLQPVSGLENTTDVNSPVYYNFSFLLRDAAGVLTSANSDCDLKNVAVANIQGFLAGDRCFIATAAFGSREAAPVRLLRSFRDQVLLPFSPGRHLVSWYYENSPRAAAWVREHEWARMPVLGWLAPVQAMAWLLLHPTLAALGLLLMGAAPLFIPLLSRRRAR